MITRPSNSNRECWRVSGTRSARARAALCGRTILDPFRVLSFVLFFRDTLVITTTGLPPPRPHHLTATHVLRIGHGIGHSHSGSTHAFAPLRGVATRESSATSSRYRTYEGVAPLAPPRRAHYRRRAGCLQPENSGPFVLATARTLGCLRAPAPLCGAPANQSYPIDLTSRHHQPHARRLVHRVLSDPPRNGLAVLPKRKTGLEVRGVRRCPWLCTAPLGRRPARASCNRLSYAKADSCPPPCSR